jgi:hypothetical protein
MIYFRLGAWVLGALGISKYFSDDDEKLDDGFIGPVPMPGIPEIPENEDFWKYAGILSVLWLGFKYKPWK